MTDFDYKKYSLEKLEDWLHDAMSSAEASPEEIYATILESVTENVQYYKSGYERSLKLLKLMTPNEPELDAEFMETLKKDGYSYTPQTDKNSWSI